MAKTTDPIASLQAQLGQHRQQRDGLQAALDALPTVGDTPSETVALAQTAHTRRTEIAGLDAAIATLQAQLAKAKAQAEAEAVDQAIADDAALLERGRDRAAELAAELAAAVAQVADVLHRIGNEMPVYDAPYRRSLRRQLPADFPTSIHRAGAIARAADAVYVEGLAVWKMPSLIQVSGAHFALVPQSVDIRPPAPKFSVHYAAQ